MTQPHASAASSPAGAARVECASRAQPPSPWTTSAQLPELMRALGPAGTAAAFCSSGGVSGTTDTPRGSRGGRPGGGGGGVASSRSRSSAEKGRCPTGWGEGKPQSSAGGARPRRGSRGEPGWVASGAGAAAAGEGWWTTVVGRRLSRERERGRAMVTGSVLDGTQFHSGQIRSLINIRKKTVGSCMYVWSLLLWYS